MRSGDVYFVGTAASVVEEPQSGGYGTRRYLFTVTEAFTGVSGAVQEVVSTMSSCGVEFSQSRSYLVAARLASDGTVRVHACSRTAPAEDARDEMEILRSLAAGKKMTRVYGAIIEFRDPQPYNLATDPELYQHLPNVRVTIAGAGGIRETVTDAAGTFRVDDLPPGRYRVSAHLSRRSVRRRSRRGPTRRTATMKN